MSQGKLDDQAKIPIRIDVTDTWDPREETRAAAEARIMAAVEQAIDAELERIAKEAGEA